jgi:hypothetical protein
MIKAARRFASQPVGTANRSERTKKICAADRARRTKFAPLNFLDCALL